MNVLVVFTYNYSLNTWVDSGTFNKEIEIYKLLSEKGLTFTFLTFSEMDPKLKDLDDLNIKVIPVYKKIKRNNSKLLNYLKSFLIPFYFKNQLQSIDVIKQNQLSGAWISIIFKFLLKKPLLVRTGYDMYEFSIKESKKPLIIFLYKTLTFISLKFSDLYTVSSKSDITFLSENFKIKEKNIKIRPNWVKESNSNELSTRDKKKIICVGRLEKQKNFEFIISAFAGSDFEIDLIGTGSLEQNLKDKAIKNNTKVNFLGKLNNEEILELLNKYKFYISSSFFEGNPKSTLEAMAAGCIVFASDIPNHVELINDKKNGFIFPLNMENFKDYFEKEISRNDLNLISNNAKKIAIENSIFKLVNLEYKDLMNLIT
tara:strand:- start:10410 stop:11522 length:1113 start_codon:yes stop_codon:yes gene_type:complete